MSSSNNNGHIAENKTLKNTEPNLSGFTFSDHTGGHTTLYLSSNDDMLMDIIPEGIITKLSMIKPVLVNCSSDSYTNAYLSENGKISTVVFLKESEAVGSTWTYEITSTTGYSYITEYKYKGLKMSKTVNNKKYESVIEIEQNLYTIIDDKKELSLSTRSWYSREFGLIERY